MSATAGTPMNRRRALNLAAALAATGVTTAIAGTAAAAPTRYNRPLMKDGWVRSGGRWYVFKNGHAQFGWHNRNGSIYYMARPSGANVVGWHKIEGIWFYFAPAGHLVRRR